MSNLHLNELLLTDFSHRRPTFLVEQERSLDWLARAHARAGAGAERLPEDDWRQRVSSMRRRFARFGADSTQIAHRGSMLPDFTSDRWDGMRVYDLGRSPHGRGMAARAAFFEETVDAYFDEEYASESAPPADLVHVTCTGYVSPSAPQKLAARRGWSTRVMHAYHMGCYAAFPAVRLAGGMLALDGNPAHRVDVVHTELCTLHLDPSDHSAEQLVVQSLFADGLIRYAVRSSRDPGAPGLRVLALDEAIVPDSAASMRWLLGDYGLQMVLARDVPEKIAGSVRGFVAGLAARAGLATPRALNEAIFAVHPGGPSIIDRVAGILELAAPQVQTSRDVLRDHGNMSSATLPHVWMRLLADRSIPAGTPIVSLAFGPGLTVCGGVFRKQ